MDVREVTLPAVLVVLALVFTGLVAGYALAGSDEHDVEAAQTGPAPVGTDARPSTIMLPAVGVPSALKPRVKPRPKPPTTTPTVTAPTQTVPAPQQPKSTPPNDTFDSVG